MLAADKLKLDNAVSAPTASRLAIRDTAGRLQIASPSAVGDAATKAYVDDAVSGKVNSTDIANGIRSDILKGHGEIIGDDGKRYGFVGGTIRNDSDAWYSHENTTHAAVGTTTVSTDTTQITIGYPGRGHVKAVTLIAGPDETLATAGISVGASVANHQALIRLGGEVKYAGLIQYDGTDFVVTGGNGATASWDATNSIVVVGHGVLPTVDNAGAHDVQVTSRGDVRSFIAASRAITRGSFGVGFRSAGGVALTDPSTQMRFTFRHSTAARLNPQAVNTGLFPNSNIWYFGVFEL